MKRLHTPFVCMCGPALKMKPQPPQGNIHGRIFGAATLPGARSQKVCSVCLKLDLLLSFSALREIAPIFDHFSCEMRGALQKRALFSRIIRPVL
jgi:hypothetical protein